MLGLQVYMVYLLLIWSIYDYTKADPWYWCPFRQGTEGHVLTSTEVWIERKGI